MAEEETIYRTFDYTERGEFVLTRSGLEMRSKQRDRAGGRTISNQEMFERDVVESCLNHFPPGGSVAYVDGLLAGYSSSGYTLRRAIDALLGEGKAQVFDIPAQQRTI